MKITLPESIKDITLGQYQKFDVLYKRLEDKEIDEVEFLKRKISLFSGIPYSQINNVLRSDLEEVVEQVDKALAQDSEFEALFTLNDIEFGFVDNLHELATVNKYGLDDEKSGAYFDMSEYGTEVETLHKLMAVLFRPIKKKDKYGNYKVEKYKGSAKYSELFKKMPLNVVNGSLVFFCNLSSELRIYIQKYTEAERVKEEKRVTTLKNGDGIAPSMS